MHLRGRILDAVATRLAVIPAYGAPGVVSRRRAHDVPEERLPHITVTWSDGEERVTGRTFSAPADGAAIMRELPVSVIIHFKAASDGVEQAFDAACLLIEAALAADPTLDGLATDLQLQSSRLLLDPSTGRPVAAGRLTYIASYTSAAASPALPAL